MVWEICSRDSSSKTATSLLSPVKTFKIAAPTSHTLQYRCSGETMPSKSLLRLDCLRNRCSGSTKPSKTLLRLVKTFKIAAPARLCLRNHCSGSTLPPKSLLRLDCAFEIALLRTVHCFELYFVRLHRRRKAPYANLVYIYINIYSYLYIDDVYHPY